MRLLTITMLIAASLMLASCEPPAANTAANKPANNANAVNSAAPVNTAAIEADVKKMISDYAVAAKGDAAAYDKMTTDNFMFIGNDGSVETKAERMGAMKSGAIKYDTLTYDDVNVRVNPEGNGAVAISRVTVKGVNNNIPMDRTVRVTHVWSKMKDGWKLASLQATDMTAKTDDKAKAGDKTAEPAKVTEATTDKAPDPKK